MLPDNRLPVAPLSGVFGNPRLPARQGCRELFLFPHQFPTHGTALEHILLFRWESEKKPLVQSFHCGSEATNPFWQENNLLYHSMYHVLPAFSQTPRLSAAVPYPLPEE